MHSRRASSLVFFFFFFLFCLPGWSASEFNLNRSRPVAFPEPSALVMESLSRRRVVHGCFSGCVFFFFFPRTVAEANTLVPPHFVWACTLTGVESLVRAAEEYLKEKHVIL